VIAALALVAAIESAAGLSEVVVTAQRRQESLQWVMPLYGANTASLARISVSQMVAPGCTEPNTACWTSVAGTRVATEFWASREMTHAPPGIVIGSYDGGRNSGGYTSNVL